jgi:peptidoglycan hydrolase-like protein with peptidoglycan-binding domain
LEGGLCYCSTGYEWNSAINSCVVGYPTFTKYLGIGSTGTDVINLKNFLAIEGLYTGYVSTPFDKATATAVSLYQKLHNISSTGTVGPLTRASLDKSVISGI